MKFIILLVSLANSVAHGRLMGNVHSDRRSLQNRFPSYSQQCRDDAGPPFLDDEETFGPGRQYHYGSAAEPILKNGQCADPLKSACSERKNTKLAYLEGPIQCGGNGWYCRMYEEPGWPQTNLRGDFNFGDCNTTEGFNDHGWDGSGHCHGSDDDSTYYWWVRDHWFRQYNGRVRCCCNWATGEDPLLAGKVANRCDFRRLVKRSENLDNCRDANENHNMGFNDVGCIGASSDGIGKPLEENDAMCWEISKFGASPENGDGDSEVPMPDDEESEEEPEEEGSEEEENEEEEGSGEAEPEEEEPEDEEPEDEEPEEEGSEEEENEEEEGSGEAEPEEEEPEEEGSEEEENEEEEGSGEEETEEEEGSEEGFEEEEGSGEEETEDEEASEEEETSEEEGSEANGPEDEESEEEGSEEEGSED